MIINKLFILNAVKRMIFLVWLHDEFQDIKEQTLCRVSPLSDPVSARDTPPPHISVFSARKRASKKIQGLDETKVTTLCPFRSFKTKRVRILPPPFKTVPFRCRLTLGFSAAYITAHTNMIVSSCLCLPICTSDSRLRGCGDAQYYVALPCDKQGLPSPNCSTRWRNSMVGRNRAGRWILTGLSCGGSADIRLAI